MLLIWATSGDFNSQENGNTMAESLRDVPDQDKLNTAVETSYSSVQVSSANTSSSIWADPLGSWLYHQINCWLNMITFDYCDHDIQVLLDRGKQNEDKVTMGDLCFSAS